MSKLFHIGFDIADYNDILPDLDSYLKNDVILNMNKGDINDCVWYVEGMKELGREFNVDEKRREIRRCFDTGVWIVIKGMIIWIPPYYYFFLTQARLGDSRPEFRLNRLVDVYQKIRVRRNPYAIGTFTMKSRQIGETTFEMMKAIWEVAKLNRGLIGIQSMTRKTVQESCWLVLLSLWDSIDKWMRDEMYSDYTSGKNNAEKMKFSRNADGDKDSGKNVQVLYTAGTFDSVADMRFVILDEWLKWIENSPYATFLNYKKFIVNGIIRKGLFQMFSSPMDRPSKYMEDTYLFWQNSNPEILNELSTTNTGIFRFYTSPLTGIGGMFDKFGDADPDPIYSKIMADRKTVPKELLAAEIRGYPLNEKEMFETQDNADQWTNSEGIENRKVYLIGTRKKPDGSPARIFGNLEWENGIEDTDVIFIPSGKDAFNEFDSRFCVSYIPKHKTKLRYGNVYVNGTNVGVRPLPPEPGLVDVILGIDPYQKKYRTGASNSNAGMVAHKFRDFYDTGINKCPILLYCNRPYNADTFHEDAIKAAVYTRSLVQPESITDKVIDYFEMRGYMDWLLPKIGHSMRSKKKGDAPSGSGRLMGEVIGLIDAITNRPALGSDEYPLNLVWFYELLDDVSKFDRTNTQKSDLTMAWGQALLGAGKLLLVRPKKTSQFNMDFLSQLIGA